MFYPVFILHSHIIWLIWVKYALVPLVVLRDRSQVLYFFWKLIKRSGGGEILVPILCRVSKNHWSQKKVENVPFLEKKSYLQPQTKLGTKIPPNKRQRKTWDHRCIFFIWTSIQSGYFALPPWLLCMLTFSKHNGGSLSANPSLIVLRIKWWK